MAQSLPDYMGDMCLSTPIQMGKRRRRSTLGEGGFTLIEMLIAISILSLVLLVGSQSIMTLRERTVTDRAAATVGSDVALTRSLAIRTRSNVSLAANETAITYEIRDTAGTVFQNREFTPDADLPLTKLDVRLTGDSLTFNSRGLLVGAGGGEIDVFGRTRSRRVVFNALARYRTVDSAGGS